METQKIFLVMWCHLTLPISVVTDSQNLEVCILIHISNRS